MAPRVVVVTGGTRGVGAALVEALRARGDVVVAGGRALADVGTEAGVGALMGGAFAAHGRVDALVCTAAIAQGAPEAQLGVGLLSLIHAARWMRAGSRIVCASSEAAAGTLAGFAAYTAAKAGVEALVRALARELEGVVVTGVRLETMATDMTRPFVAPEVFARLPGPEAAVPVLTWLLDAPGVNGRVYSQRRFARDAEAEAIAASAILPPIAAPPRDVLETPYGVSPAVRTALARMAESPSLGAYPSAPLAEEIALHHRVPEAAIALGAGVTALVERVLAVAVQPGERVIAADPGWPVFERAAAQRGAELCKVACDASGGSLDLERVLSAIDPVTRLVYLISPAYPTGVALRQEAFERFLARVPEGVTVAVDETYEGFATRAETLRASRLAASAPNLVVLRSFSKLHGLAGFRAAYAVARPKLAELLTRLAPTFEIPEVTRAAAIAALRDRAHIARVRALNDEAREALRASIGAPTMESEASFVLAEHPTLEGLRFFDGRWVLVPVLP